MISYLKYCLSFVLLFSFTSSKLIAQELGEFNSEPIMFIDNSIKQPIFIVNDSTYYEGYELVEKKLISSEPFDFVEFSTSTVFNIKNQIYLVNKGCGKVFMYREGVLQRIDTSFNHRNQYNGLPFEYNNQIYMFGGQGLFTTKNILTVFSFTEKKWQLVPYESKLIPENRQYAKGIVIKDTLFMFGGIWEPNRRSQFSTTTTDSYLWAFDFKTRTWTHKGKIENRPQLPYSLTAAHNSLLYELSENKCHIYDVTQNTQHTVFIKNFQSTKQVVYDPVIDKILLVNENIDKTKYKLFSINANDILETNVVSNQFYEPIENYYLLFYTIAFLLFSIPISLLIIMLFIKYNPEKLNKPTFQNNGNKEHELSITDFELSAYEKKTLNYLLASASKIQISSLNTIFDSTSGAQETYGTINKRREKTLQTLKVKLAVYFNCPTEDILIETKHPEDRRIKLIELSPSIKQQLHH